MAREGSEAWLRRRSPTQSVRLSPVLLRKLRAFQEVRRQTLLHAAEWTAMELQSVVFESETWKSELGRLLVLAWLKQNPAEDTTRKSEVLLGKRTDDVPSVDSKRKRS